MGDAIGTKPSSKSDTKDPKVRRFHNAVLPAHSGIARAVGTLGSQRTNPNLGAAVVRRRRLPEIEENFM